MNYLNPKDLIIIKDLPPVVDKAARCAIDVELFGMDEKKMHRPTNGRFASMQITMDGRTVYFITDENNVAEALSRIENGVWIFHNAKFDLTHLRRWADVPQRKRLWDTMLIEQIMYSGYFHDFSLADLCRRRLDIYLEKSERETFETTDSLSQEQIEYASLDAAATWLVYKSQRAEISENDMNVWKSIDLPALWTVLDMKGMRMDVALWKQLYEKASSEAWAIQKKYMENPEILDGMDFKTTVKKKKFQGILLTSPKQVLDECHRLGYKKLDSTNEDEIAPFVDECEFIRDVLEFRGLSKQASTYGINWIEDGLIEEDDCIYSDFHINGAATGRFSSSSPNLENIPIKDTSDFRKCFVAHDGWVLVDGDWSAQEPRIAAYLSNDEKLKAIFVAKKDVYIETGRLMFGWNMDKSDPRRKTRMKPTVLGASYGLTEFGMEKKYGVPEEEGAELLHTFFETFEGMANWKKSQQAIRDYVHTIYGRRYWLNPWKQKSENNALNSPVQGSAADVMKCAGAKFMWEVEEAGLVGRVQIVNFVHDELLIECKEELKEWTMDTLRKVMIDGAESMHKGIPADVEISSGHSWADAHN